MRNLFIFILCSVLLASCKNAQYGEFRQEYPVLTVSTDSVEFVESYSASIRGRQDIDIYPQVSGTISRLCVQEGQKVVRGEVLFIIDQVPYKAALRTATANVHAAQAQVETAKLDYNSKQELYKENVISEYELLTTRNTLSIAKAGLEQAEAQGNGCPQQPFLYGSEKPFGWHCRNVAISGRRTGKPVNVATAYNCIG